MATILSTLKNFIYLLSQIIMNFSLPWRSDEALSTRSDMTWSWRTDTSLDLGIDMADTSLSWRTDTTLDLWSTDIATTWRTDTTLDLWSADIATTLSWGADTTLECWSTDTALENLDEHGTRTSVKLLDFTM
jgi:hypothetical protein